MSRGHELGQRWVAEDGIVGEADEGDVEIDQLRAEIVVGAEGHWEPDLSQGAGRPAPNAHEGLARPQPPPWYEEEVESFD